MGRKKKTGISNTQKRMLDIIIDHISTNGYPPSVREISEKIGLSSTATIYFHLKKLEEEKYIRRDSSKMRAIEIINNDYNTNITLDNQLRIPLIGKIAAGSPILAEENIEEYVEIPVNWLPKGNNFILKVIGSSMINAGIKDSDLIFIRQQENAENGDIVAAVLQDKDTATVKRYYNEKDCILLKPENDEMQPMIFNHDEIRIIGKVVGLYRRL